MKNKKTVNINSSFINSKVKDKAEDSLWLTTRPSYTPELVDQILRWSVLGAFQLGFFPVWLFIISQIIIVPIVFNVGQSVQEKIEKKYFSDIKVRFVHFDTNSPSWAIWLGFFTSILAGLIVFTLLGQIKFFQSWNFLNVILSFISFLLYAFYIFFVRLNAPTNKILSGHIYHGSKQGKTRISIDHFITSEISQLNSADKTINLQEDNLDEIGVDENDKLIIHYQSELKSMNNQVETYLLESVFIGALSFSGFLSIVSSDALQSNIIALHEVLDTVLNLFQSIIGFNWDNIIININNLFQVEALLPFIGLEALLCSIFFVLVLASRIKFANLIEKVDYQVRLASIYNAKEEEMYLLKLQTNSLDSKLENRYTQLNQKINQILVSIDKLFKEVNPLLNYMIFFRNLGLLMFYSLLVTGAMYFSLEFAVVILILALISSLYRRVQSWININRVNRIIQSIEEKRNKNKKNNA